MRRVILSACLLLGVGALSAQAQSGRYNNDDVYYNSEDARSDSSDYQMDDRYGSSSDDSYYNSADGSYSGNGRYRDYGNSYSEDYNDNANDYYYYNRINRFNYPYAYGGYWGGFYSPYTYDRYWVDPYWGYNPWYRPGFSISFGGPYWSSYWGYNSWYGYNTFGSYYGYPYYAGYGGIWCGGYGNYYGGYWNGYYSGFYGRYGARYGYGRTSSYGPRYSMNGIRNSYLRNNSTGARLFHGNDSRRMYESNGMRPSRADGMRGEARRDGGFRNGGSFRGDEAMSRRDQAQPRNMDRSDGGRRFNGMPDRAMDNQRMYERSNAGASRFNGDGRRTDGGRFEGRRDGFVPQSGSRMEGGRFGGRSDGGYSPQMQQGRMNSAPSRSFDGGGMRSGGFNGGGMRSGSFNGGGMRGGGGFGGGGGMRGGGRGR